MANFSKRFGDNPGVTIDASRSQHLATSERCPLLFRNGSLGGSVDSSTPQYPLTDVITEDVNLMDPNLQVPYADSWTLASSERSAVTWRLRSVTSARVRGIVGTLNYNEINIFDNRFLNEFRAAQANLRANVAAGLASQGFAYRGPGTGTVPLPIMFAYFQGAGDPNNAAFYTSTNFRTNNTYLTPLATFNPNPFTFANNLFTTRRLRTNAANAGQSRRTSSSPTPISWVAWT